VTGTVYFMPVDVGPNPQTMKGIGVNVTTAYVAGTAVITVTLGLYKDDITGGKPDLPQLLYSGTIDASATGIKLASFPSDLILNPGRYWLAFLYVASVAPTTAPSFTCVTAALPLPLPGGTAPGTLARAYTFAGTALPTTVQTLGVHGGSVCPVVALRAK
jgi:hypothetical protein